MNKRLLAALLTLLLIFSLSGCGSLGSTTPEPTAEESLAPEITYTPEPTVEPAPTLEPVAIIPVADYEYVKASNSTLNISFEYPSHWEQVTARKTLRFEMPVNEGEMAPHLAVSYKSMSKKPTDKTMKTEMNKFFDVLKGKYQDFENTDNSNKVKILDTTGYRSKYTAKLDGEEVAGYILMAYASKARKLYLVHFVCPAADYSEMSEVVDRAIQSMRLVK